MMPLGTVNEEVSVEEACSRLGESPASVVLVTTDEGFQMLAVDNTGDDQTAEDVLERVIMDSIPDDLNLQLGEGDDQ